MADDKEHKKQIQSELNAYFNKLSSFMDVVHLDHYIENDKQAMATIQNFLQSISDVLAMNKDIFHCDSSAENKENFEHASNAYILTNKSCNKNNTYDRICKILIDIFNQLVTKVANHLDTCDCGFKFNKCLENKWKCVPIKSKSKRDKKSKDKQSSSSVTENKSTPKDTAKSAKQITKNTKKKEPMKKIPKEKPTKKQNVMKKEEPVKRNLQMAPIKYEESDDDNQLFDEDIRLPRVNIDGNRSSTSSISMDNSDSGSD